MTERPDGQTREVFGGTFYAFWRGDPLPDLGALPGFEASRTEDVVTVSALAGLDSKETEARLREGNLAYLATLGGRPVALGWSAHRRAKIGELGVDLVLPSGNRYLWDFFTLPEMRGRGLYTRLLQRVIIFEQAEADRFWVGHDPGNRASGRGILKSGFRAVGEVWKIDGEYRYVAEDVGSERVRTAAELLGIPLVAPTSRFPTRQARC